jgi:hypothetical protein
MSDHSGQQIVILAAIWWWQKPAGITGIKKEGISERQN